MNAYSELYLDDIMNTQGDVFNDIREALPGIDEKWFISEYMKGRVRRLLDHANPKFAAMPSPELIDYFIEEEQNGEYKRGEAWGGFLPMWAGMVYAMYQWKYNISSSDLIDKLTLTDIERIFPALHQMGWDAAIEKIHKTVLGQ